MGTLDHLKDFRRGLKKRLYQEGDASGSGMVDGLIEEEAPSPAITSVRRLRLWIYCGGGLLVLLYFLFADLFFFSHYKNAYLEDPSPTTRDGLLRHALRVSSSEARRIALMGSLIMTDKNGAPLLRPETLGKEDRALLLDREAMFWWRHFAAEADFAPVVIQAMAALDEPGLTETLYTLLPEGDIKTRQGVYQALGKIFPADNVRNFPVLPPADLRAQTKKDLLWALQQPSLRDSDEARMPAWILLEMGDDGTASLRSLFAELTPNKKDPEQTALFARQSLAGLLASAPHAEKLPADFFAPLWEQMARLPEAKRRQALLALKRQKIPAYAPQVQELLLRETLDISTRKAALETLSALGDAPLLDYLEGLKTRSKENAPTPTEWASWTPTIGAAAIDAVTQAGHRSLKLWLYQQLPFELWNRNALLRVALDPKDNENIHRRLETENPFRLLLADAPFIETLDDEKLAALIRFLPTIDPGCAETLLSHFRPQSTPFLNALARRMPSLLVIENNQPNETSRTLIEELIAQGGEESAAYAALALCEACPVAGDKMLFGKLSPTALRLLARLGNDGTAPLLLHCLQTAEYQKPILEGVAQNKCGLTALFLTPGLPTTLQITALSTIQKRDDAALELATRLLDPPSGSAAIAALEYLQKYGIKTETPLVEPLLKTSDENVRKLAEKVLPLLNARNSERDRKNP